MPRLRNSASCRLFRGKWRLHGVWLFSSPCGRGESNGHSHGHDGKRGRAAGHPPSATAHCFPGRGLYHVSRTGRRRSTRTHATNACDAASCSAATSPIGGQWRGASAPCWSSLDDPELRACATCGLLSAASAKDSRLIRIARNFSWLHRCTQLLCRLHEKRRDTALPDVADMLLWRSAQLALGHS